MSRKEPPREIKINRIYAHLDALAAEDGLDEVYIDDLLSIVQQYRQMVEERRKHKGT
jgi:hypothetical protein